MSGNTVLAMRAVQEAVAADPAAARAFFDAHLFGPIGARGVVWETDPVGTFIGSSFLVAPARAWARVGQLYVDDGWSYGRRLLPEPWRDYVSTPTPESTLRQRGDVFWEPGRSAYGAGFWRIGPDGAGRDPGLPADTFDANGFQGQYLHIIPSADLVVVRMGATNVRGGDFERLPREVLAARLPDSMDGKTRASATLRSLDERPELASDALSSGILRPRRLGTRLSSSS